jgi:hypothetical protein
VHIIAVNIEVTIPMERVIAKPLTGPVPMNIKLKLLLRLLHLHQK